MGRSEMADGRLVGMERSERTLLISRRGWRTLAEALEEHTAKKVAMTLTERLMFIMLNLQLIWWMKTEIIEKTYLGNHVKCIPVSHICYASRRLMMRSPIYVGWPGAFKDRERQNQARQ